MPPHAGIGRPSGLRWRSADSRYRDVPPPKAANVHDAQAGVNRSWTSCFFAQRQMPARRQVGLRSGGGEHDLLGTGPDQGGDPGASRGQRLAGLGAVRVAAGGLPKKSVRCGSIASATRGPTGVVALWSR